MSERPLPIAKDHPAYVGHFPGAPILPAVVLLAEALAAVERDRGISAPGWTLAQAKFTRGVTPGAELVLACEDAPRGGVRFEIRSAEGIVASGAFARTEGAR